MLTPCPTRRWSWDTAGTEGQTGPTFTRSGRRWLSMARYPSRLCSTGVCKRGQASRHCPPGRCCPPAPCLASGAKWAKGYLPRSPAAGTGLAEGQQCFPGNGILLQPHLLQSCLWDLRRPRAHPLAGTLTEYLYCRNRSFWVITNWAFLLFITRFPSSRERTSGLGGTGEGRRNLNVSGWIRTNHREPGERFSSGWVLILPLPDRRGNQGEPSTSRQEDIPSLR